MLREDRKESRGGWLALEGGAGGATAARPRRAFVALAVAVAVFGLLARPATGSGPEKAGAVARVDAIGITVSDLDRAVAFYTDVLSFEKTSEAEAWGEDQERLQGVFGLRLRTARLRLGEEHIELTEYLAPRGRPFPAGSRGNDRWFQHVAIITSDMERAYRHLRQHRVEHASTGPQRLPDWNRQAGGIRAFYFRDPDGHFLEVLQFPGDKGDPRWRRPVGGALFLGIDHTAIVVADTDASLRLYRDALGMKVAGESENHGTEQEHLNNVFGARLRITALRAPRGPGIELLEYLAPRDGRPAPDDLRANDLAHWQTRLVLAGGAAAAVAAEETRARGARWVSPGWVALRQDESGFKARLLLRDPDGHALELARD